MYSFDKEKLANLIKKAIGNDRSLNQYALHCQVSSAHISRLSRGLLNTPPTPQVLQKMADASQGRVTYDELMKTCGYIDESNINDYTTEVTFDKNMNENLFLGLQTGFNSSSMLNFSKDLDINKIINSSTIQILYNKMVEVGLIEDGKDLSKLQLDYLLDIISNNAPFIKNLEKIDSQEIKNKKE